MNKLNAKEIYSEFLSNIKSEEKQGALVGCVYMDVVRHLKNEYPKYFIDTLSDLALDMTAEYITSNDDWSISYIELLRRVKNIIRKECSKHIANANRIEPLSAVKNDPTDNALYVKEDTLERISNKQRVKTLIRECPSITDFDKKIIYLRYVKGLTIAQTAQALHVDITIVKLSMENTREMLWRYAKNKNLKSSFDDVL